MDEDRGQTPEDASPETVLILAPIGRDAVVLRDLLVRAGLASGICLDVADLLGAMREGAGVLLLTEEALVPAEVDRLAEALRGQPSWSDLPVVVLASGERPAAGERALRALRRSGNLILLHRPARALMLATTVQSALRARLRQYEFRGLLRRTEALNDELRQTLERERLGVESAGLGYWDWDITAGVVQWDPRHNRMIGLPEGQSEGRYEQFLERVHPEDRTAVLGALGEVISGRVDYAATFRAVWSDGTVRWITAQGRAIPDAAGRAGRIIGVVQDITARRRLEEGLRRARGELEARVVERTAELARANDALRSEMAQRRLAEEARTALLRQLVTAQEAERRRVARDLHDQFGQLLTGLSLELRSARDSGPLSPRTLGHLGEAQRAADELGRGVHDLALRLRPTALDDLGLRAALLSLLEEGAGVAGVEIDFQADSLDAERLSPEVETTLYRVVQEALNNIYKHAGARHVSVVVERHGGHTIAVVEDDGRGFDSDAATSPRAERGGLGLLGMRERVALAGGTLDIESAPGHGTTVIARVPLAAPGGGRP